LTSAEKERRFVSCLLPEPRRGWLPLSAISIWQQHGPPALFPKSQHGRRRHCAISRRSRQRCRSQPCTRKSTLHKVVANTCLCNRLPEDVDLEKIEASCDNGVLSIRVPRRGQRENVRQIPVNASSRGQQQVTDRASEKAA
jgi:hypothetical protein